MNDQEAKESLLIAYALGELYGSEKDQVELWLKEDPHLATSLKEIRESISLLQSELHNTAEPKLDAIRLKSLNDYIEAHPSSSDSDKQQPSRWSLWLLRPAIGVPVFMAGLLTLLLYRQVEPPLYSDVSNVPKSESVQEMKAAPSLPEKKIVSGATLTVNQQVADHQPTEPTQTHSLKQQPFGARESVGPRPTAPSTPTSKGILGRGSSQQVAKRSKIPEAQTKTKAEVKLEDVASAKKVHNVEKETLEEASDKISKNDSQEMMADAVPSQMRAGSGGVAADTAAVIETKEAISSLRISDLILTPKNPALSQKINSDLKKIQACFFGPNIKANQYKLTVRISSSTLQSLSLSPEVPSNITDCLRLYFLKLNIGDTMIIRLTIHL
ncbi:MAG: hypothetical protein KDD61_00705 [Bdellovibrionales bacterium]|nr:hypothetical protein [Bdellovibrionales bacterium]